MKGPHQALKRYEDIKTTLPLFGWTRVLIRIASPTQNLKFTSLMLCDLKGMKLYHRSELEDFL